MRGPRPRKSGSEIDMIKIKAETLKATRAFAQRGEPERRFVT
jgi:hypothetical protein